MDIDEYRDYLSLVLPCVYRQQRVCYGCDCFATGSAQTWSVVSAGSVPRV
jgi:hypothetical protein